MSDNNKSQNDGQLFEIRNQLEKKDKELETSKSQLEAKTEELNAAARSLSKAQTQHQELVKLLGSKGEKIDSWRVTVANNMGLVITGLVILFVIGSIVAFFYAGGDKPSGAEDLIDQLSDSSNARGLITFMIVVGTIVMGLLLLVSSFRTDEGAAESFTRGKEIFTILVGILGTIVGFYFGLEPQDAAARDSQPGSQIVTPANPPGENSGQNESNPTPESEPQPGNNPVDSTQAQ